MTALLLLITMFAVEIMPFLAKNTEFDETGEKNIAFNTWFDEIWPNDSAKSKGINQVEIRSTVGMGRGVYALRDIEEVSFTVLNTC